MHRLSVSAKAALLASALWITLGAEGCGNSKPAESASSEVDAGADPDAGERKDECIGFEITNLEDMLLKDACEEAGVSPDSVTPIDLQGKLEVTLTASPTKPSPGGKVDLLVTFANKTSAPLPLHFKLSPIPRFEVEAYDVKKAAKRADIPTGEPPPPPKGSTQPPASEAKSARITIAANGTARARIPWDVVKTRWAPEKYRGTPPERGYPRAPAGALPKGRYNIRVVSPLIGVSEGVDHEMSAPRVELDIGG